jgi:hypothetical protein
MMETVYYMKMNIGSLEQKSVRHYYNTHHRLDLLLVIIFGEVLHCVLMFSVLKLLVSRLVYVRSLSLKYRARSP